MAALGESADEGGGWDADRVRRATAAGVVLVAGLVLLAWFAKLESFIESDALAPLSPLSCIGFLACAAGLWLLPRGPAPMLGAVGIAAGVAGIVDAAVGDGRAINLALGADARISALTATELILLGTAVAVADRRRPPTQRLAIAAGAIAAAAGIGFLLAVPLFIGTSRLVHMSWQAVLCALLLSVGVGTLHPSGPLFESGLSGRFARGTLPAALSIPVVAGALSTAAARAGLWPFSVAAWVMTLAAVAGVGAVVAMAVNRLAEDDRQLTELAIRDPLTGAYNRRHFITEAQRAATRSQRYREGGAIAVVDLDHFKEINDRWGHAAGDEALVRVQRALRARLRSSDVLGRIGGDEFAAIILRVDEQGAAQVADELRDAVAAVREELASEGRESRLGASVGIAPLDGPENIEAQIELADQRMYQDKRGASRQEVESGADH